MCDTDVIIELYKNSTEIIEVLKQIGQSNIAISTITAGELLYGALNKKELSRIKQDINNLTLIAPDAKTSEIFLDLMTNYSLSHKLSLPDGLIAASAIANGLELYTLNKKDYRFIKGLVIFNPEK